MTSRGAHTLRVDLEDFDGSTVYATYGVFNISDRADNYRLHVSGYSGTAGQSATGVVASEIKFCT